MLPSEHRAKLLLIQYVATECLLLNNYALFLRNNRYSIIQMHINNSVFWCILIFWLFLADEPTFGVCVYRKLSKNGM